MYYQLLVFLTQSKEAAETALQTNPYNALGYGVLVFVLMAAVYFVWKAYQESMRRHQNYVEKTVGLVQLMESKMDVVEEVKVNQNDLKREINSIGDDVQEIKHKISK